MPTTAQSEATPPPASIEPAPPTANADAGAAAAAAADARKLRRIVRGTLVALVVLLTYQVIADRLTPYTSQATVDTFLVQIAPEVSGPVVAVGVRDNRPVKKGQMLFRIEAMPFEIALRAAAASLAVAIQGADSTAADVLVADASLRKQKADLAASQELGKIVIDLSAKRALAETSAIRARADIAKSRADITRAEAELERARIRSGQGGNENDPQVRQARAALEQAKLDLIHSTVVAPANGLITNLRLAPGQYASRGAPVMSFIADGPRWVTAAMRENQLGNIRPGNRAYVVFDDYPGRVFKARVDSVGWGVAQGGEAPTGTLPSVDEAPGWLREPQRFPVRVMVDPPEDPDDVLPPGRSGAQANVVVLAREHSLFNPIARVWIGLVSLLSYLR
jgi:multidrug resistance efflux pump